VEVPVVSVPETSPVAYVRSPALLCKSSVLRADCLDTMSIEDARSNLTSERERYWIHLKNPSRRRIQNRINRHVYRWCKTSSLETAEDYHKLALELRDLYEDTTFRQQGRLHGSPVATNGALGVVRKATRNRGTKVTILG
jgi:hypothetical protein